VSRGFSVVVLVLAAGACNQVFGLHETQTAIDAATDDPCAPITPFDPNRYYATPGVGAWSMGRSACQQRGMDLAVIDATDNTEIAMELDAGEDPYWFGVSYGSDGWVAIDGCTPYLPTPPPNGAAGDCLLLATSPVAFPCDSNMLAPTGPVLNALCETPRADAQCLALEAHSTYVVADRTHLSYNDAVIACDALSMHLVEINSTAELEMVVQGVAAGIDAFWVGAQAATTGFSSPTTCPQVFVWGNGQPDFEGGNTSVLYNAGGMALVPSSEGGAAVCEANAAPM